MLLPNETASNKTGGTEETIAAVLEEISSKKTPPRSTPEVYDETPIFITVDIMEDVVELVARKLSRSLGTSRMDSEALQSWVLKVAE